MLALAIFAGDVYSKGFSSGGRSGGFSSGGRSSFSSPKTSSSSKRSTSSSSTKSSSFKPASQNKGSSAPKYKSTTDKVAYEKAVKSGTAFKTRDEAVKDFSAKHGAKYTSTFPKEPVTRPSYIPQTTTVGGRSYNINYNPQYGGYGYMNSLGTWMMFDALTDAATMTMLMNNHGYYTGSPYAEAPKAQQKSDDSSGIFWIIIYCIGIFLLVVLLAIILE